MVNETAQKEKTSYNPIPNHELTKDDLDCEYFPQE